jgi:hypothetical protein
LTIPALTLTVASAGKHVPPPDPDAETTHIWAGPDGEPAAYFYPVGRDYWASFPGIGAYQVSENGEVVAIPEPSASDTLVVEAYRRTVLPQALQFFGREVIHASAVVAGERIVGFCAYSQTGKSTVAFGLSRRGYPLWGDDALAFETAPDGAVALSLPFEMRLRPASRAYFGFSPPDRSAVAEDRRLRVGAETRQLAALFVLLRQGPDDSPTVAVRRLQAGEAFSSVLPHAYWTSLVDEARKKRMLRAYLELTGSVPVYELAFPPSLDELPAVLDAVESALLVPRKDA